MAASGLLAVLLASLPLGFAHALDADHVAAVSTLAARENGRRASLWYAAQWALGHGGLLLLIATATLLFRWALPPALPQWAERCVGLVLIVAGISMLWALVRGHAIVGPHRHAETWRLRAPFVVGMIHGTAGSAAMLALIPMTLYRPELGLAYVLVFSLGVMAGMMGFGLVLGQAQTALAKARPGLLQGARSLIGIGAIGMGVVWLQAG
jgi:nickel/cobalt transporter (NicO) family protein